MENSSIVANRPAGPGVPRAKKKAVKATKRSSASQVASQVAGALQPVLDARQRRPLAALREQSVDDVDTDSGAESEADSSASDSDSDAQVSRVSCSQQPPAAEASSQQALPDISSQQQPEALGRQQPEAVTAQQAAPQAEGQAPTPVQGLNAVDLSALYQNCMKLASENKIGPKNTWSLPLIDHLSDLVKPSRDEGDQTNFQRASCTLDAGVKIYSYRVDNIHSETYKVLSGMGRGNATQAGGQQDGDEDAGGDGDHADVADDEEDGKRARRRALQTNVNPSSTLEASWAALNVKKFDLAFEVDPLFKKTSAQFDEGGAKGLLLNNLSVFRGCEVVFDSFDVPERALDSATAVPDVQVDLSSLQAQLDTAFQSLERVQISPSLHEIYKLLGKDVDPQAAADAARTVAELAGAAPATSCSRPDAGEDGAEPMQTADSTMHEPGSVGVEVPSQHETDAGDAGDFGGGNDGGFSDDGYPDDGPGDDMDADEAGNGVSWLNDADRADPEATEPAASSQQPASSAVSQLTSLQASLDTDAVQWLLAAGSGASSAASLAAGSSWAGAAHWKYRAAAAGSRPDEEGESSRSKPARRKRKVFTIDFLNLPQLPAGAFALAAPKDICLKKAATVNTLLPEDVHYQASSLAQLFLKPNAVLTAGAEPSDGLDGAVDDDGYSDDGFGGAGGDDYGDADDEQQGTSGWGNMDFGTVAGEGLELVSAPRKIEKISINYARASKVVDVHVLKETLRQGLESVQVPEDRQQEVSFQDIVARIPADTHAGRAEDLSVHLCFICLLHLANEHGLAISGRASLDALTITHLPPSWL